MKVSLSIPAQFRITLSPISHLRDSQNKSLFWNELIVIFLVHYLWCFGIKYVLHSSQSHKGKPHIHRLSNKFACSVITLYCYIIFKWYQHLSWFVFLPKLKTKNLGANRKFEIDRGELCEQAGQWNGEGKKVNKAWKKAFVSRPLWATRFSPTGHTECSLCEWRSLGTCLPTVSVFVFAWSHWAVLPAGPSSFHGQKMPPGKERQESIGEGGTICSDVGGHFMSQFILFVLYL